MDHVSSRGHWRQVFASVTVLLITLLMQEHAARVVTFLILPPRGAVLGRTVLGFQYPVSVLTLLCGNNG